MKNGILLLNNSKNTNEFFDEHPLTKYNEEIRPNSYPCLVLFEEYTFYDNYGDGWDRIRYYFIYPKDVPSNFGKK